MAVPLVDPADTVTDVVAGAAVAEGATTETHAVDIAATMVAFVNNLMSASFR